MPMKLLVALCCARLPIQLSEPLDIEKCEVLLAAELIEADMPPVFHQRGRNVHAGQATVMRVTAKGQSAAKQRG
ncbi:hypothetical protein [Variovorax boronicumulans]|uniref:hypothetical protein n=1 Tax=Variovorax boronicumulans TaxID=436515 RepID=UPI0033973FC6